MKYLLLAYLITTSSYLFAGEEVLIEDPDLVAQLNKIQMNLDEVSLAIATCLESGKEHSICMCESKEIIIKFNASVKSLIEEHKDFSNLDLLRFKSTDGSWVTQSLEGLLKQASAGSPPCS